MQNKLVYFFIFFLCFLLIGKVHANDQFSFDVTKIEILNNGSKIIGKDRGLIKSNNGITIDANNFEYDLDLNILKASGNVIVTNHQQSYKIFSNDIIYFKNKNLIEANNNIKIIDSDESIIQSNQFLYDINKNLFKAKNNVEINNLKKNYKINSESIEFFKNQNKIIGKGLTKLSIENNYFLTSKENLNYQINKKIVNAKGEVRVIDKINEYTIIADNINFSQNEEEITTKGSSNLLFKNKFDITSKDIFFSNKKNIIHSKAKASIIDKENKIYYEISNFYLDTLNQILKGENISINSNFDKPLNDKFYIKNGVFDLKQKSFITKDISINLKKDIFNNKKNDPRLKGVSSSSKNGVTTINKGVFTSCQDNDDCPPWSIQAEKIEYDSNKKTITYDNALLKIYDTPIFYFPKFFHPGPTVKRQSGFLAPGLGNSKILGSSVRTPYYWAPSENKDFTFTPTVYSKDIIKLQKEFRLKNKNSSLITDFSFVDGYKSKTNKEKSSITHFFSKYSKDLNFDNFKQSSLELSLQKVNNDSYLKVFDQSSTNKDLRPQNNDILTSEIKLNLENDNYKLFSGLISYENLQKSNSDRYEFVLPYYNLSGDLSDGEEYGYLSFSSTGDNVLKDTNNLRSRIINTFDFRGLDLISKNGIQSNINIFVKNLNTSGKKDTEYKSGLTADMKGILELRSALPMIKGDSNYINYLEPKISLRINPFNMNDYSDVSRKIDNNNIFDLNRLGLQDTIESGNNLTVGLDYRKENLENINEYFELKLGTIIRQEDENNIPLSSGIMEKNSNIFGNLTNRFNENISINYDFSINNNLDTIEYSSLGFVFSNNLFETEFNFIEENGVIGNSNIVENISSFNFNENNNLSFKTRQNRKLNMAEYYNLIYEYKNDCLIASVAYDKTYYEDKDLVPSENLMFKLTLIPITTIGQSISN